MSKHWPGSMSGSRCVGVGACRGSRAVPVARCSFAAAGGAAAAGGGSGDGAVRAGAMPFRRHVSRAPLERRSVTSASWCDDRSAQWMLRRGERALYWAATRTAPTHTRFLFGRRGGVLYSRHDVPSGDGVDVGPERDKARGERIPKNSEDVARASASRFDLKNSQGDTVPRRPRSHAMWSAVK